MQNSVRAGALILLMAMTACLPPTRGAVTAPPTPEGFAAFERADVGYRAVYPKGWVPRAGTEARFQNFVSPDQKSILLISLAPNRFSNADLEEAGARFQLDALGAIPPARPGLQQRTTLNGVEAIELTGEYAIGDEPLMLRYYAFNRAERTWIVAYLGPAGRYMEEQPLFERFAGSFQVLDRTRLPAHLAQIGQRAPDFALLGIDGQPIRLGDFRGRPVLVSFWASWCPDCRAEMPLMNQAYREAAQGLAVVGINYGEEPSRAAGFARQLDLGFPLALDPNKVAGRAYGVIGPPTSFFIARDGVVRHITVGPMDRQRLVAALRTIL